MFNTNRNPFAQAIDSLNRAADVGAEVPIRQQERLDIATEREQELTDEARQERRNMLADVIEAMSQLDPDDPEDQEAFEIGNQLIDELTSELGLRGEEAMTSLGRGRINFTDRIPASTVRATPTVGAGATNETGQSIVPSVTANVGPRSVQRSLSVAQGLARVGAQGARAERRREVETQERVFKHEAFLQQMQIDANTANREDLQEFEKLMTEAEQDFLDGQLSTELTAQMVRLLAQMGHETSENALDRQLSAYLDSQETARFNTAEAAKRRTEANADLWTIAGNIAGMPDGPAKQAELNKLQAAIQANLQGDVIAEEDAARIRAWAETQEGMTALAFRQAAADTEFAEFRARAAELGVELDKLNLGQKRFDTAEDIANAAFNAAQTGNFTALGTIEMIANMGTELGYSQEQVETARRIMAEDMPMLEATARGVFENTEELRRIALDNAKLALRGGQLNFMGAQIAFAREIAGSFETLEEAEAYLTSLPVDERAALKLDTPEGRQAFLGAIDYAIVLRDQQYWGGQVEALSAAPVDTDEWGDQFMFALSMSGLDGEENEGVRQQLAAGYRRLARNEDDELDARIQNLRAQAELARASAKQGGNGSEAFRAAVTGLGTLLQSVEQERQQACAPVATLAGETPRIDEAACSLAQDKERYWQGQLEALLATNGVLVPRPTDTGESEESDDETDIRAMAAANMTREQIGAQMALAGDSWENHPELDRELFPRENASGGITSLGDVTRGIIAGHQRNFRAGQSVVQNLIRFTTGGAAPTANERVRFAGYDGYADLLNAYLDATAGEPGAEAQYQQELSEAASRRNLNMDPRTVERLLIDQLEAVGGGR